MLKKEVYNENTDGCYTAYELGKLYGISKLKVSRAIASGSLTAFMPTVTDEDGQVYEVRKWYIRNDELLTAFISQNATKGERKQ